jgi:hypothetical protein
MKDIIMAILFYWIWNSPAHQTYPNAVPILFTLWIVMIIIEFIEVYRKS